MPFVQSVGFETGLSQNFQFIDLCCNNPMIFVALIVNLGMRNLFDGYQRKVLCNIFLIISINPSSV